MVNKTYKPKHLLMPEYMVYLKYLDVKNDYVDTYRILKDTDITRNKFLAFKDKLFEYGFIETKENNAAVEYRLTEKGKEFVLGIDYIFEKLNVKIESFIHIGREEDYV